jgi:hypothetical protein
MGKQMVALSRIGPEPTPKAIAKAQEVLAAMLSEGAIEITRVWRYEGCVVIDFTCPFEGRHRWRIHPNGDLELFNMERP